MNTAKMHEFVQKAIAQKVVLRAKVARFTKQIGPAARVLLKVAKFAALFTLCAAAWCICRLVFLFQSWTEKIHLRERAAVGFDAMLSKMRSCVSKIENLFGQDWKQIFTVTGVGTNTVRN